MFDKLLNLIVKASNLQPAYTPEHCLVVTKQLGGCRLCKDACPHDAIRIGKQVEIDDIDCTGCGLCVQACPSQALEPKISLQSGAPVKCSQVKGSVQTVQCLGRLQASDMLKLAGRKNKVTLARGECENCSIGSAVVPDIVDTVIDEAQALAALRGRELSFDIKVTDTLDITDDPDPISRRELLRGGWKGARLSTADLLAPLEQFATIEGNKGKTPLPYELQKHYAFIKSADPEPADPVPWVLPRVAEGCIMCPVCTNVCPTDAFRREFDKEGGGATLMLEPDRCNGCNACVKSCPVHVITLDGDISWGELSGGQEAAFRREPKTGGGQGAISRE